MGMFSKFSKKSEKDYSFVLDKAISAISSELTAKVKWRADTEPAKPTNDLFEFWSKISGAHKWYHYFSIYEKIFNQYRNAPIKILEIGVAQGASIKLWRNFFSAAILVGVDIHPDCKQFEDAAANIFVRIGSQADKSFLEGLIQEFGPFDIIIDDGSHVTSHMIESFNTLFLHGLSNIGIYFVEDTHSNYWLSHRDTSVSFNDLAKSLVDIMHYHYTVSKQEVDFRLNSESRINSFDVPLLTTMIEEVRFFDSIIVIYKNDTIRLPVSEYIGDEKI